MEKSQYTHACLFNRYTYSLNDSRLNTIKQVDKAKCIIASVYNIQAHQLVLQGTEGGPGTVELFCQCSIVDIQGNCLHNFEQARNSRMN